MRKALFFASAVVILLAAAALAGIYSMTEASQGSSQALAAAPREPPRLEPRGPLAANVAVQRPSDEPSPLAPSAGATPVLPPSSPLPAIDMARYPSRRIRPGPGNLPALPALPGPPAPAPPPVPQAGAQTAPVVTELLPPLRSRPKRQHVRR